MSAPKLLPEMVMTLLAVVSWVVLVFHLPEGKPTVVNSDAAKPPGVARADRAIDAPVARASGPSVTGSAIPARVTRRLQQPMLSVTPVLLSQLSKFKDRSRYDWLVVLED